MQTATIEQNRQRDYERAADYERQRLRTDEITHASERLAAPMRNTFEYELGEDNELWFQGQKLGTIFDGGIKNAWEITRVYPHFSVILTRALIERDEYDHQRVLATSTEDEPDLLVIISPIADAALAGGDFGESFDTVRKKALIRIHERTKKGVRTTSLSLDGSDSKGLQMIAKLFGETIKDEDGSEDILALRMWGYKSDLAKDPIDLIRQTYDAEMKSQYGGEWYAGRQDSPVLDAKEFIEKHTDLIDQHLKRVIDIRKAYKGQQLEHALRNARYDFAAAVGFRAEGRTDIDGLAEAGDTARSMGIEMKDDCPTGVTAINAAQSTEKLGYTTVKKLDIQKLPDGEHLDVCMTCPRCKKVGVKILKKGKRVDYTCVSSGCTTLTQKNQTRHRVRPVTTPSVKNKPSKAELITMKYGEHARVRTDTTIGGADQVIYDSRTGEVITKL